MDFISIKKFKFYTKETTKYLNIVLIAIGFIILIILIKYKPMYEVKISGESIGYIENKQAINETIKNNIEDLRIKIDYMMSDNSKDYSEDIKRVKSEINKLIEDKKSIK